MEDFEPIVIAFCCHYCAYTAADLAGTMRLQYPPNVRIVRLPCTGKVDVRFLLEAFEKGADGVLVSGCHFGGHYISGNERAVEQFEKTKRIIHWPIIILALTEIANPRKFKRSFVQGLQNMGQ